MPEFPTGQILCAVCGQPIVAAACNVLSVATSGKPPTWVHDGACYAQLDAQWRADWLAQNG